MTEVVTANIHGRVRALLSGPTPALRAALTLATALFAVLSRNVAAPGLSYGGFPQPVARGGTLGLFALGVSPVLFAMALVEVIAAVVPRLRHLRHSGPPGRAKLTRIGGLLTVPIALAQIVLMTRLIERLSIDGAAFPARFDRLLFAVSLLGAAMVSWIVAHISTRAGLVNGYAVVFLVPMVFEGARALVRAPAPVGHAMLGPLAVGLVVSFVALAAVRTRAWIPLVGVVPSYVAAAIPIPIPVAAALGGMIGLSILSAIVTWFVHVGFVRLFYAEEQIKRGLPPSLVEPFDHRQALLASVLVGATSQACFLAIAVMAPRQALGDGGYLSVGPLGFLGLAALVLDAGSALRAARGPHTSLAGVEHRAWAVPAIERALSASGVRVGLRNARLFATLQFFFPLVPVEIWVEPRDLRRAQKVLRRIERGEDLEVGEAPEPRPLPRWRMALLVCGASMALFFPWQTSPGFVPPPRVELEVVRLDDAADPFAGTTELPKGGVVLDESVPLGVDAAGATVHAIRHYVRVARLPDETVEVLRERVRIWLAGRATPPDTSFALGDFVDGAADKPTVAAVRTFVVRGPPILGNADIESADPMTGPDGESYVGVTLVAGARGKFHTATAEWAGRRIGLVFDGRVDTTPTVTRALDGTFSITLGGLDRRGARSRAEAARLAAAIRSK